MSCKFFWILLFLSILQNVQPPPPSPPEQMVNCVKTLLSHILRLRAVKMRD